jgi:putative cardiolipin synthase
MNALTHPTALPREEVRTWLWHAATAVVLLSIFGLISCGKNIPKDYPRTASYSFEPSPDSQLAQIAKKINDKFGQDKSGFLALDKNEEALKWRLALADHAKYSIDAQYFIWHGDESGLLLLHRLVDAADRGVRVRILVDDLLLPGHEEGIAILTSHPNIEIRVFNPWEGRGTSVGKGVEFLGSMTRLNQRMHNKLFVADNRFAIVGGRNIGNEYYGLSTKYNFSDLDVLCAGPVARELSKSFDIYWNSEEAYPGEAFALGKSLQGELNKRRKKSQKRLRRKEILSQFPLEVHDWSERLNRLPEIMSGGTAKVVYDEPLVGAEMPPVQMFKGLKELDDGVREEVFIITPYFIPHGNALDNLQKVVERGVRVKILTNSLASTDSPIAHSGYQRYRRTILERGIELYELRHDAEVEVLYDTPPVRAKYLGLHSKAIVVDRSRLYIGSSNLDPRSIYLNTEIGLIIDAPVLADELARLFDRDLTPENTWRVRLDDKGNLTWESSDGIVGAPQPARTLWQRIQVFFFSLMPVEDQI